MREFANNSITRVDAHGALARAGIKRPKVTVTADDPRLERGKPFPDPFLLAAKVRLSICTRPSSLIADFASYIQDLGIPIEKCLVFEDSPSGIKAGVVSGARTIAICTSHPGKLITGLASCLGQIINQTLPFFQLRKSITRELTTSFLRSTAFSLVATRMVRSTSVSF